MKSQRQKLGYRNGLAKRYRIERRVIDGVPVDVKIYPPAGEFGQGALGNLLHQKHSDECPEDQPCPICTNELLEGDKP